jgi:hypothetical protein
MLGQGFFYFQTTRKLIAAFGQLFNDIVVSRFSNNGNSGTIMRTIKVPIAYAPMDKTLMQLLQKVEPQTAVRTKISLPRMSYQITGFAPDNERKLNTLGMTIGQNLNTTQDFIRQLNPVPYDISFELNIMVKNDADGLQIIEQILPSFTPDFNLPLETIPELQIIRDIPIIMVGISQQDSFEGSLEEMRVIIWRIQFVAKSFLYPVIRDAELIKQVQLLLYPDGTFTDPTNDTITVEVAEDSHGMDILDSNGNPIITTTITDNI